MSTYLDTITVVLALITLVVYSKRLVDKANFLNIISFIIVFSYLFAQANWTTSWMLGYEWGRDFANYLWFVFNTSVFILLFKIKGD